MLLLCDILPACLLACLPACPGFASRTFLVLLANLIDISQFLTPLPVYAVLLRLPFSLSCLYRVFPFPLTLLPRALRVRPQRVRRGRRVERREASSFPPIALPRERHGAATRRAGSAVSHSLPLFLSLSLSHSISLLPSSPFFLSSYPNHLFPLRKTCSLNFIISKHIR